ncbi:peptidase M17, leucyl aminopeptidase, partial [Suillus subalutaceus]|uniref:peptidase M17, leucyl aminopeptidase n=1 Tax=Suillus subalutaceus TaxID=48586 RepID=UPI001B881138
KSVEIDSTDAEGRLVLADALYYATTELKLHRVTTLTGAIVTALGEILIGVFMVHCCVRPLISPVSDRAAGNGEYDRFWCIPLDEDCGPQTYYSKAGLCSVNHRS